MTAQNNLKKDKALLVTALHKACASENLSAFLDDLLTEEEILNLAQRIKIAKLILDGKTCNEIAEKIQTSTSTVSKIEQIIKYGKGGFQKIHGKIK